MATGSWGKKVVFSVDDTKIFSPNNIQHTKSARWNTHKIIGRKPKSEFVGPDMGQVTMSIKLAATLGVKPSDTLTAIENALDSGKVNVLKIGNRRIGKYQYAITSISESYNVIYNGGQIAEATIDITFSEYR